MAVLGRMLFCFLVVWGGTAEADESPDSKEVYIESIKYRGKGCREGSVSHLMAPDAKAFTLLFDEFVVEGDSNDEEKSRRSCQIDLDLHVPPGWSYALFCLDYRGYVDLRRGAVAKQRTAYFFQGTAEKEREISNFRLKGPLAQDYFHRALTPLESSEFSSCSGKDKKLRINTSIEVKGEGMMTVDSADGELKQHYGIAWRRCNPNQPGRRKRD